MNDRSRFMGAILGFALVVGAFPAPGVDVATAEASPALQPWGLEYGERPLPEGVPEAVAATLRPEALTLLDGETAVMHLWLVRELPPATGASPTGQLNYPSIPVGALMGVLELERDHIDYRDQGVPTGTYAVRYLQQPVDGAHVGVTFFRDFLALMPLNSGTTAEAIGFQRGLARALQLNPHPFVWALWPADEIYPPEDDEEPFLTEVEPGKWALRITVPRTEGDPLPLGLVIVGSEPPEGYF